MTTLSADIAVSARVPDRPARGIASFAVGGDSLQTIDFRAVHLRLDDAIVEAGKGGITSTRIDPCLACVGATGVRANLHEDGTGGLCLVLCIIAAFALDPRGVAPPLPRPRGGQRLRQHLGQHGQLRLGAA